jgi:isocitrate dehydrogenase
MILHITVKGPISKRAHQAFEDLGYIIADFEENGIHYQSLFELKDTDYKEAEAALEELVNLHVIISDAYAELSTGEII